MQTQPCLGGAATPSRSALRNTAAAVEAGPVAAAGLPRASGAPTLHPRNHHGERSFLQAVTVSTPCRAHQLECELDPAAFA